MRGGSPRQQNPDMEHVVGLSLQSVPTSAPTPITLILTHALHAMAHVHTHTQSGTRLVHKCIHNCPRMYKCRTKLTKAHKGADTHITVPCALDLRLSLDTQRNALAMLQLWGSH